MSGMMTSGLSGSDTMVAFSVTGLCRQDLSKTSNMTLRVPRSRMSQTMQNIHRMGGQISGISLDAAHAPAAPKNTATQSSDEDAES